MMFPSLRLNGNRFLLTAMVIFLAFGSCFPLWFTQSTQAATDQTATIYYKKGFSTPYIHYKASNGQWTTVPGLKMSDAEVSGYAKITISLGSGTSLTACFNNGGSSWDSRNGQNYIFPAGVSTITNGSITSGAPLGAATPAPTSVPTVVPSSTPTSTPTTTPVATATPVPSNTPNVTATPGNGSTYTLTFSIDQCNSKWGQSCWIVGSFSNWSTTGGIKLSTGTTNLTYPKWSGTKTFPAGTSIQFKTVVAPESGGTVTSWEGGNNRSTTVNADKTYIGTWGTSTVNEIITSQPTATPVPTNTPSVSATPVPTNTPSVTATPVPTNTPSVQELVVYYKTSKASFIHYKVDQGTWTVVPGQALSTSDYFGYQQFSFTNNSNFTITGAFNDGLTNWDNKGGSNYTFKPGIYTVENGVIRNGVPYSGGNVITIYYPHHSYDYGARYQFENAHFRPEGSSSWTILPGVPLTHRNTAYPSHTRADLNIGNASQIAELAIQVRSYGGSSWVNNGGSNFRNITPGTYTLFYGKLIKAEPTQLPGSAMAFVEARRGVGHGCYNDCAYLNGSVRTVPLGTTQRVILNYQIPSGQWKQVDAMKRTTSKAFEQYWDFATPATYMESPKQFYLQYIVDNVMIEVDSHYTMNYNAESAVIIGEAKLTTDCGIGFGSTCGYFGAQGFETGAVVNKEWNSGIAPVVEVIYAIEGQAEQVIQATANGTASINGILDNNHEAYRFTLPVETGKKTHYKLRTTMNGITYTNDNVGGWFTTPVQP